MSKSPKLVFVGDCHLEAKLFNIPELGQDNFSLFGRAVDKVIELDADALVVTGDLYNDKFPNEKTVAFVSEKVRKLRAKRKEIIGICGDHDLPTEKTWIQDINGVLPPTGMFGVYGANFENFFNLPEFLLKLDDKVKVEWLIFHGQVPELFRFAEPKKLLEFSKVDVSQFPNLKGVVLGDIHAPLEGNIRDEKTSRKLFIGYCGSLGVTASDEIANKTGLLYFDGDTLSRIPFPMERDFVKISLVDGTIKPIPERVYKDKKPVYVLEYSSETRELLKEYRGLYETGIVRTKPVNMKDNEVQATASIRSELNTMERAEVVLKDMTKDESEDVFNLAFESLTTPMFKSVLDAFKERKLA